MTKPLTENQTNPAGTLLRLIQAQLQLSVHQGNRSASELSEHFSALMDSLTRIARYNENMTRDNCMECQQKIEQLYQQSREHIQNTIIAMQFYDRLSQQLNHVSQSVAALGMLTDELPERQNNKAEWQKLFKQFEGGTTTAEQDKLISCILDGDSVDKAIERVLEGDKNNDDDDIELF